MNDYSLGFMAGFIAGILIVWFSYKAISYNRAIKKDALDREKVQ